MLLARHRNSYDISERDVALVLGNDRISFHHLMHSRIEKKMGIFLPESKKTPSYSSVYHHAHHTFLKSTITKPVEDEKDTDDSNTQNIEKTVSSGNIANLKRKLE